MRKTPTKSEQDLEELLDNQAETSEMGEVVQEFSSNKPSSSNLSSDEFRLAWRAKNILRRMSPSSVEIIEEFVDMKRSVKGWNTERKVEAITGIQQQRQGGMLSRLFSPKQPGV